MITLRDYQQRSLDRLTERRKAGILRFILQLPTGGGKTLWAAVLILLSIAKGRRVLFIAHRLELIDQAIQKLILGGLDESKLGVICGNDPRANPNAPVQIASIQSLRAPPRDIDLIIIDEAHRSRAKSYYRLFEAYPKATFVGLTATPERLDGQPLDMFQEIIVAAQPLELARHGWISEPLCFTPPAEQEPDLSSVRSIGGDFDRAELMQAIDTPRRVGDMVEHWKRLAENRRTIVFGVDIQDSKKIAESFLSQGIPTEQLDGKSGKVKRRKVMQQIRSGEILVVTQADLWIEGIDIEELKCAILGRPTESLTICLQSIGRILRPWQGIVPLVLDHAGNLRRHGLPMEPRHYDLRGRVRRPSGALTKTCPGCFTTKMFDTRVCDRCGHVFGSPSGGEERPRAIRDEEGFLVEVPQDEESMRRQAWDRLVHQAAEKNYKSGWAAHQYKTKFGQWPPSEWSAQATKVVQEKAENKRNTATDRQRRDELIKLRAISHRNQRDLAWAHERYEQIYGESPSDLLAREQRARVSTPSSPTAVETQEPREELDIGI